MEWLFPVNHIWHCGSGLKNKYIRPDDPAVFNKYSSEKKFSLICKDEKEVDKAIDLFMNFLKSGLKTVDYEKEK